MLCYPVQTEKSRLFSPLVSDYLKRNENLSPFINNWPDENGFKNQIEIRKKSPVDRTLLQRSLRKQYENTTITAAVEENLGRLTSENTFTVTTGQQIHAFLGPMYVYWKIVSAIALSRDLKKKFPGNEFVPVFWMATEDHDFEEINHLEIFNKNLVWENDPEFSGPVGLRDTSGLGQMLDELDELFIRQPEWKNWSELFRKAYSDYGNLAQATRFLVNELFGKYGLIIIDPNDAGLKQAFATVVLKELDERKSFNEVEKTSSDLEKLYSRQLNPREINLFYFDGKRRERIEVKEGKYTTTSGRELCTSASLDGFVKTSLPDISANVVLRPVYQEMILPNIAYIGGPGEIAYWLQLKGVFELYDVPFPILENRKSVFLLGKKIQEQVEKQGFKALDLFEEERDLNRLALEISGTQLITMEEELAELLKLRNKILGKASSFQGINVKPLAEIFSQQEKNLKKVEKEIYNLQKIAVDKTIDKMLKIRKTLKDEHFTQERNQYIVQYLLTLDHEEIITYVSDHYSEMSPVSLLITD